MKNNNVLKAIISCLFIFIVCVSLYGCKKNPNQNIPPVKNETNETTETPQVIEYENANETNAVFSKFGLCATGYELNINNNEKLEYSSLPKVFVNNTLYNYLNYNNMVKSNKVEGIITENNPKTDSFTKSDLEKAIENVYGDVIYDFGDTFDLGDYKFTYNRGSDTYTSTIKKQYACGNIKLNGYNINSIYINNYKELRVNIYYYKYKFEVNDNGYKTIFYGTKNDKTFEKPDYTFINQHPENFINYEFVFKSVGDSYVFDYIEVIG